MTEFAGMALAIALMVSSCSMHEALVKRAILDARVRCLESHSVELCESQFVYPSSMELVK